MKKNIEQQISIDKEEGNIWLHIGTFGDVKNEIHITIELTKEDLFSLIEDGKKLLESEN